MPRKTTSKTVLPAHLEGILPECAANLATLSERLLQVAETQDHIAEMVYGNGKVGLKDQTEANSRDIAALTKLIADMAKAREVEAAAHQKEIKERQHDAEQRKGDIRKWWLGIAAAAILALIAVAQNVAIAAALSNLAK